MPFSIAGVILKIFNYAAHDILFHVVHNFDKFVFVDVMFACMFTCQRGRIQRGLDRSRPSFRLLSGGFREG